MADVRTLIGRRSRTPGTTVGVEISTFGLKTLAEDITGEDLAPIVLAAMQPAHDQAYSQWPVLTGASKSTIRLEVAEINPRSCRVVLQVGGEPLISHPDNKSHKDYAPYLEFNGSPSGSSAPGVIRNAIYDNDTWIKQGIKDGLPELLRRKLA